MLVRFDAGGAFIVLSVFRWRCHRPFVHEHFLCGINRDHATNSGSRHRARLLAGLPVIERRLQVAGVSTAVLEGGEAIAGTHLLVAAGRRPNIADLGLDVRPVTPEVARQAVAIGARVLWLQEGIVNEEARRVAEEAGLTVIMGVCIRTTIGHLEATR